MPRYANQNKITDALIVITILKQIPRHWITASQIQQNLSALGMEHSPTPAAHSGKHARLRGASD